MLERSVAGRKASVRINGRNGMSHDNVFVEFDDSRQTDTVERTTVPANPCESPCKSWHSLGGGLCSDA